MNKNDEVAAFVEFTFQWDMDQKKQVCKKQKKKKSYSVKYDCKI